MTRARRHGLSCHCRAEVERYLLTFCGDTVGALKCLLWSHCAAAARPQCQGNIPAAVAVIDCFERAYIQRPLSNEGKRRRRQGTTARAAAEVARCSRRRGALLDTTSSGGCWLRVQHAGYDKRLGAAIAAAAANRCRRRLRRRTRPCSAGRCAARRCRHSRGAGWSLRGGDGMCAGHRRMNAPAKSGPGLSPAPALAVQGLGFTGITLRPSRDSS